MNKREPAFIVKEPLKLRAEAGIDKEVLAIMPKDELIESVARAKTVNGVKWAKVLYRGIEGYCMREYLEDV